MIRWSLRQWTRWALRGAIILAATAAVSGGMWLAWERNLWRARAEILAEARTRAEQDLAEAGRRLRDLEQIVTLSRYYTLIGRAAGCSHEVSVPLVAAVRRELAKDNPCGFTPEDLLSLMLVESCFDPSVVSRAGAIGIAQIMPATAREFGVADPKRLHEVDLAVEVAVKVLNRYAQHFGCDRRLALLSYNRGPGRIWQLTASGRDPSNSYDDRVIRTTVPGGPK